MRILALHLPQFHEVPENNEWWGQGFTEWNNVRAATQLFDGHQQPLHPLDDNYYDLSQPSALIWQARTARCYGVDGFVFFHYWYEGKQLLEKPVNLWSNLPQADLEYCLCWANHPWTRSWDGKEHEVLQAQTYGELEDWDSHLDVLLHHFRDPRYIRKDGKPILFLYNAGAIPSVNQMIAHWRGRLSREGFAGLYVVEYISTKNPSPAADHSDAVYEDEPLYTLRFGIPPHQLAKRYIFKKLQRIEFQRYDDIWERMLRKKRTYGGREIIQGAFVAWDNSPRRGRRGPMIVRGSSAQSFGAYLRRLLSNDRPYASDDFLVINAWNEWGEGAVLEPSREEGFGFLEALQAARGAARRSIEAQQ